jgi:hypothetical protein
MISTYYKQLSERLRSKCPELVQIALFNGQYQNTERELPIRPPAVFIEFASLQWATTGNHTQEALADINLHIVCEHLMDSEDYGLGGFNEQELDTRVLDVIENVTAAIHGFQMSSSPSQGGAGGVSVYSTELLRTQTRQDVNADGLQVWVVACRTTLIDNSRNRDNALQPYLIPKLKVN